VSRRGALRRRHDDGASSVEMVLLTPALMLFVFTIIQVGLWFHAKQVVTAAAQEGARAARRSGATAADGRAAASAYIARVGGASVTTVTTAGERSATSVQVTVSGRAVRLIPGFPLAVRSTSTGPVERFRAP
jgi:Flp pilus assembly protein TadG